MMKSFFKMHLVTEQRVVNLLQERHISSVTWQERVQSSIRSELSRSARKLEAAWCRILFIISKVQASKHSDDIKAKEKQLRNNWDFLQMVPLLDPPLIAIISFHVGVRYFYVRLLNIVLCPICDFCICCEVVKPDKHPLSVGTPSCPGVVRLLVISAMSL